MNQIKCQIEVSIILNNFMLFVDKAWLKKNITIFYIILLLLLVVHKGLILDSLGLYYGFSLKKIRNQSNSEGRLLLLLQHKMRKVVYCRVRVYCTGSPFIAIQHDYSCGVSSQIRYWYMMSDVFSCFWTPQPPNPMLFDN